MKSGEEIIKDPINLGRDRQDRQGKIDYNIIASDPALFTEERGSVAIFSF